MAEIHVRRDIGLFALTMTGLGSIIGSGWLFGAWRTAQIAGVGALSAWVIGAVAVGFVALVYSELGAMFPEVGGVARFGYYSHGSLIGFIAGWANWIAMAPVVPMEAEASAQYVASWPYAWAHGLYHGHELTPPGLALAGALVVGYFLLNFWGVKLYARTNGAITVFKLVVPAATGIALIVAGFHPGNFHVGVAAGKGVFSASAVMTAVATSGIVLSFNGFQSPVSLAGEARNAARDVPVAVLGSIALAAAIYLLLQFAFIGSTPPKLLGHGWAGVNFSSPFAELALALNLNWLAILLYADAFVSPSGTGATFTAVGARTLYAMARSGALPRPLGLLHRGTGVPRNALWFDLAVAYLFLICFRGWGSLAAVISASGIVAFLAGPVAAATLRRTAPDIPRPMRLPALQPVAMAAFVISTLLLYWARWPLTGEVILLVVIALPIYVWAEAKAGWSGFGRSLRAAWWLVLYLAIMALVSFLGSREFGGLGSIPYGADLALVAAMGAVFYVWGVASGWRTPFVAELKRDPHSEPHI